MQTSDQASDSFSKTALEFLGYIWADLLIFAVSASFCVLSAFLFPKAPRGRPGKQQAHVGDDPFVRIRKLAESALVAAGLRKLPPPPPSYASRSGASAARVAAREAQASRGPEPREVAAENDSYYYGNRIKHCYNAGDLAGALRVLSDMAAAGHQPKEIAYNTLTNSAVASGEFQLAWDAIEQMKRDGVPIGVYTVSIMMKTLRQRNSRKPLHSRHHTRVFEFLDESGVDCCSDAVLLTTVVDACVWHKEHHRLEHIVESYLKSNLKPAVPVYGSLIKASKCIRRTDLAWALWRELVDERKLEPSAIALGCMLDALVCSKLVDDATLLYEEWRTKIPLSTVIYSTLAKGFLNSHQSERAMQILVEMRADGVPRSTVLYNMIIGAQAAGSSVDELRVLMQSMKADGCQPDIITYSAVVKGHCTKGDLDGALGFVHEAQQTGIALDAIIYSSMIYGCYRHNRLDLIDQLVAEMRSNDLTPSSFSLSILVQMYGAQGNLNRAFEVVDLMSRPSSNSDARVATSLLNACVRKGDLDRAEGVFSKSLAPSGDPDAKVFWPLVELCVKRGSCQRARALLEAWCTPRGQDPSKAVYKDRLVDWLRGALEGNKESEALALIEKLRVIAVQNASNKREENYTD